MKKTLALAALLAATAFTPALSQDVATAAEPTPIPERVMVQMAQNERGERRERGPRGDGEARPQRAEGEGRGQGGGWQRQQQAAPVQQTAPVQQAAPVQRQWNRAESGGQGWQGRGRQDGSVRVAPTGQVGQQGWSRQAPQAAAPVQPQQERNWQNREQRRDTWQGRNRDNANGGVIVQQQQPNRTWNGQNRQDGQWNGQRRNDSWQNNRRNDGQWNGNRRNDTWQNNGRNNNYRYDQRNQWQNQYRDWNRNWSRDWRRDQRYDWQRYRYSNRSLFRNNRYYAPYGWDYGYRRFSIGFSLSYLLYDQQYWIDDPYSYRLPPADGPYRWVRYYEDVLLVDLRSGQVVDAIYDFFE